MEPPTNEEVLAEPSLLAECRRGKPTELEEPSAVTELFVLVTVTVSRFVFVGFLRLVVVAVVCLVVAGFLSSVVVPVACLVLLCFVVMAVVSGVLLVSVWAPHEAHSAEQQG